MVDDKRDPLRICNKCNGDRELYYSLMCARCEPPEIKTVKTLNFIWACRHIDARYYGVPSRSDRTPERQSLWLKMCEWGNYSNDTIVYLPVLDMYDNEDGVFDITVEESVYLQYLIEAFDLRSHPDLLWEISW